jgi:L-histidine N-alpha-methyltransferase
MLSDAVATLRAAYPRLCIEPLCCDYAAPFALPPAPAGTARTVCFFPGSTIGNFETADATAFLRRVAGVCGRGGLLLIGVDLQKDVGVLLPAYNDAAGVTAEFNLNVLRVINRELGADFDVDGFEHVAVWDATREWIEMRLRSRTDQHVTVPALDLAVDFAAGEEMRTEVSAKFRKEKVAAELTAAGLRLAHWWTDRPGDFALSLSFA